MISKCKFLLLMIVVFVFVEHVQAQGIIIVSPVDGFVFSPGETITVDVDVLEGVPVSVVFLTHELELSDRPDEIAIDDTAPFELSYTLPNDVLGPYEIIALGNGEDNIPFSDSIIVNIQTSATLQELTVDIEKLFMTFYTEKQYVLVNGKFSDGTTINLNSSASGTVYQTKSGMSDIIEVSQEGVVTARGVGKDSIVISNRGITIEVPVVANLTNSPPQILPLEDVNLEAGSIMNIPLSATDRDGDSIKFRANQLPAFVQLVDNGDGTGVLKIAPDIDDVGIFKSGVIIVTDDGTPSLSAVEPITIIVNSSVTPSPTPVASPIPSPSPSPVPTPIVTVTTMPTPTPIPTLTPSPTPQTSPTPTGTPTAITLAYFDAKAGKDGSVILTWETVTEINNAGFNLYRAKFKNGKYKMIHNTLIPAKGDAVSGASYRYIDNPGNGTFFYKLVDVDYNGVSTMHGHEKVRVKSGKNASHRPKKARR